ncbi:MAG TPA: transposase [bacterium]|nr:transposase [bacterium]
MPRPPRLLLSQSYYHVMTRGNNRHSVFEFADDYYYYLDLIGKYKGEHPFDLFHYCLMPNHTHFLVKTNKATDFSTFMKRLNLAYFHYYRKQYDWIGHFWQDRFKSQFVGKDSYFIQCGKYIELNPVRAGMANAPEEYQYSSYRYYSQGQKNSLISRDIFYDEMGNDEKERQENYRKITIDDIVVSNYLKPVWGSDHQRYNETKKIKNHLGRSY